MKRVFLLVLAVAAASWSGPLSRIATEASPLAISFWRTAIASAVLLPLVILRTRGEWTEHSKRDGALLVASATFLALHFVTWIASVDLTTVASSVLLVTSGPVWLALVAGLRGERLSKQGWIGIATAIAGGALVAFAPKAADSVSSNAMGGNALALAGGISVAGYLMIGRVMRPRVSLLLYVGSVYSICAAVLLAAALVTRTPLFGFDAKTWVAILAIAAGPQLTAHTILNFLLRDMEAWKVAAVPLGEPIGSSIIALFLFSEVPPALVIPGGILLLIGVWLSLTATTSYRPLDGR